MDSVLQREEQVFSTAVEISDAAALAAFLDDACAGDAALRARVEESLAARAEAEAFFTRSGHALTATKEGLGLEGAASRWEAEAPGASIGPYKLLQRLGEGGCGVVYLAEQERPVRRRVALKIIKLGMDTRSVLARFAAEQQALALMDHPHIARVLDAGVTEGGRPYFVMELVQGVKLTAYCDENRLDLPQRLRLFVQVCQAIQHAHQKGIIHRDIKPSNILITLHDGVAVPKVIDFGIAKAIEGRLTDDTFLTPSEWFIGTPAYMSPEQAEFSGLDVDTRSDIYSLGVLLYELVTSKTPFDQKELLAAGLDVMRRTIKDREPLSPSRKVAGLAQAELQAAAAQRQVEPGRWAALLGRDLDWIVMKALEKDRCRRYETANGLAADVLRHLNNEPVVASPPSRVYRLRKLVRRNRVTFAAGAVVVVVLATFAIVSTSLLIKEREARRLADLAEQQKAGLAREATRLEQLRRSVEDRQRLLEAVALFDQGQLPEADALVDKLVAPKVSSDHAPMFRALGDWHAIDGRWVEAAKRFDVLSQINQQSSIDSTLDDLRYASVLVELGRTAEYDRLRESLIDRYAGTDNPIVAERVVKACLLLPARGEKLQALGRYSEVAEKSIEQSSQEMDLPMVAWRAYTMALSCYRSSNHALAVEWGERSRSYDAGGMMSREMSAQLILAMAHARRGQTDEARAELAEPRFVIEDAFKVGVAEQARWEGFWFDWLIARQHLREAEALLP
jgi:serine/threonine protein kinase